MMRGLRILRLQPARRVKVPGVRKRLFQQRVACPVRTPRASTNTPGPLKHSTEHAHPATATHRLGAQSP